MDTNCMDTNWCLFCDHHIDNELPYCSRECQANDNITAQYIDNHLDNYPDLRSDVVPTPNLEQHASDYTGRDNEGIIAWASRIPPVFPPCSPPLIERSTSLPPSASCPSFHASSSSLRPPKLLIPDMRALPPCLCMATTKRSPAGPSVPVHSPTCDLPRGRRPTIFSRDSVTSFGTDSVSTSGSANAQRMKRPSRLPYVSTTFLSHIATQVRSWVGTSNFSHSKSLVRSSEPAIVGLDDRALVFASKGRAFYDDLDEFLPPPATKVEWTWTVFHQDAENSDDYDSEEDGLYTHAIDLKPKSNSPTPLAAMLPDTSDSSSSVLEVLVEELHPAFRSRGRQMMRSMS